MFITVVALVIAAISYLWLDRPIALAANDLPLWARERASFLSDGLEGANVAIALAVLAGVLALAAWLFDRRCRRWALWAVLTLASVGLGAGAVQLLKFVIGRARPNIFIREGVWGFDPFTSAYAYNAFPSGHATVAGALGYMLVMMRPRPSQVLIAAAILLPLASTRVLITSHYVSDVAAGLALGVWCAAVVVQVARKRNLLPSPVGTAAITHRESTGPVGEPPASGTGGD